jgi:paraquat-inducible protein B
MASILLGGVAFETPMDSTNVLPAADGSQFPLASDHGEALKTPDGTVQTVLLRFHQSVRGLTIGAPVDFRGVELGQVRSIGLTYDKSKGDYSPVVIIDVFPDRLATPTGNLSAAQSDAQRVRIIEELVQRGLRAQLRPGNLLTGQLLVALDFFPNAPYAHLDPSTAPLELPTVPSDLQELYQQVQAILIKVQKIPFDTLAQDAHRVMTDLDGSLKQLDLALRNTNSDILPEVKDSLEQIRVTIQDMHSTLSSDSPLQQDTRQALQSMSEAARSLKTLSDNLARQPESLIRGKKEQSP